MKFLNKKKKRSTRKIDLSKLGELKEVYRCSLSNLTSNEIYSLVFFFPVSALFGYMVFDTISDFVKFGQYKSEAEFTFEINSLVFKTLMFSLFASAFPFVLWKVFRGFRDELKIYANGFTYQSRKGVQSCLWSEIKDVSSELIVKKKRGEIQINKLMTGTKIFVDISDEIRAKEIKQINEAEERRRANKIEKEKPAKWQTLGELQQIYYPQASFYLITLLIFSLYIFGILGVYFLYYEEDIISLIIVVPVCVLPASIIMFNWLKFFFDQLKDELNIYQNGFTYKSRKGLQYCFWDEIESLELSGGRGVPTIIGIRTKDGGYISIGGGIGNQEFFREKIREHSGL